MPKAVRIEDFNGAHRGHDAKYDGVSYMNKAWFDTDEDADAYLEAVCSTKSDRTILGGYLTVFYST